MLSMAHPQLWCVQRRSEQAPSSHALLILRVPNGHQATDHVLRGPLHWLDLLQCTCGHSAAAKHGVSGPAAAPKRALDFGLERSTCTCSRYQLIASQQARQQSTQTGTTRPSQLLCVLQELLPRIVALWHALHVPLVHRSRFYLAFQGREAFYFESEHRRLVYLAGQSSVDPGTPLHVTMQLESLGCLTAQSWLGSLQSLMPAAIPLSNT